MVNCEWGCTDYFGLPHSLTVSLTTVFFTHASRITIHDNLSTASFKINPDRLVRQLALHHIRDLPGSLGKAFESE